MNIERFNTEIGPLLRRLVVEAIGIIQKEAAHYLVTEKVGYGGQCDDIVTTADKAAQVNYVGKINEIYPWIGLIGEEDNLKRECALDGENIYITIDPLDGTKAFARGQSSGVGTMIAVVRNGTVIAGYVGDVNTGEVYGFAPDCPIPTRVRFGVETKLDAKNQTPLHKRYALFNCLPNEFPMALRGFTKKPNAGGLFKSYEINFGSFGVLCARLWKGEVAMIVLEPGHATPWDTTPVIGIMKQMGFVCLNVYGDTGAVKAQEEVPMVDVYNNEHFIVYVHQTNLGTVLDYIQN